MKHLCIIFAFLFATSLFGQENKDPKENNLSKVELGLNTSYYLARDGFSSKFVPSLEFNYYRRENQILHTTGSIGYGGSVGLMYNIKLWNERRRFLKKNPKWFLSSGMVFQGRRFAELTDGGSSSRRIQKVNQLGLGYGIGAGYKFTDRISAQLTFKPQINLFYWKDQGKWKQDATMEYPINLGVQYRF